MKHLAVTLVRGIAKKHLSVTFVIGAAATGKSHFIRENFSDTNLTYLNIHDFQQQACQEAGIDRRYLTPALYRCLHKANQDLLTHMIVCLQAGQSLVVEHTLYKAKRRIAYIDAIRNAVDAEVQVHFFVLSPSDAKWKYFVTKRDLQSDFQSIKQSAKEMEFPNPAEGIDHIFQVVDDKINLRMDTPTPELISLARQELEAEANRIRTEDEKKAKHQALLKRMETEPFWHYCEVCGKKVFCTAQQAFHAGWDYPPKMGKFGLLGARTCGDCQLKDTLYWKVLQQEIPLVIKSLLTPNELITWNRIKAEPESLLEEDGTF